MTDFVIPVSNDNITVFDQPEIASLLCRSAVNNTDLDFITNIDENLKIIMILDSMDNNGFIKVFTNSNLIITIKTGEARRNTDKKYGFNLLENNKQYRHKNSKFTYDKINTDVCNAIRKNIKIYVDLKILSLYVAILNSNTMIDSNKCEIWCDVQNMPTYYTNINNEIIELNDDVCDNNSIFLTTCPKFFNMIIQYCISNNLIRTQNNVDYVVANQKLKQILQFNTLSINDLYNRCNQYLTQNCSAIPCWDYSKIIFPIAPFLHKMVRNDFKLSDKSINNCYKNNQDLPNLVIKDNNVITDTYIEDSNKENTKCEENNVSNKKQAPESDTEPGLIIGCIEDIIFLYAMYICTEIVYITEYTNTSILNNSDEWLGDTLYVVAISVLAHEILKWMDHTLHHVIKVILTLCITMFVISLYIYHFGSLIKTTYDNFDSIVNIDHTNFDSIVNIDYDYLNAYVNELANTLYQMFLNTCQEIQSFTI